VVNDQLVEGELVECNNCGTRYEPESPVAFRTASRRPCPNCGNRSRRHHARFGGAIAPTGEVRNVTIQGVTATTSAEANSPTVSAVLPPGRGAAPPPPHFESGLVLPALQVGGEEHTRDATSRGVTSGTNVGSHRVGPDPARIEADDGASFARSGSVDIAVTAKVTASGRKGARTRNARTRLSDSSKVIDATSRTKVRLQAVALVKKQCIELSRDKSVPKWQRKHIAGIATDLDILREYARGEEVPKSLIDLKIQQLRQTAEWLKDHAGLVSLAINIGKVIRAFI
jgi:hypothetical protein